MNESEARAYIGSMENGRMNPTLSVIERISKALNVSVGELMK
ncbi:MAG: helix-turn-helix protein [Parcubacteria group bacterium]|nr:helix-turn-helix protein [Parcubacteria group bacterium]